MFSMTQVRQVTNQKPVNARSEEDSQEEPTEKPVVERRTTWQKNTTTPVKPSRATDPTERPLSERFAGKPLIVIEGIRL